MISCESRTRILTMHKAYKFTPSTLCIVFMKKFTGDSVKTLDCRPKWVQLEEDCFWISTGVNHFNSPVNCSMISRGSVGHSYKSLGLYFRLVLFLFFCFFNNYLSWLQLLQFLNFDVRHSYNYCHSFHLPRADILPLRLFFPQKTL